MGYETIRFERQQLYEMVWAKPMTTLAREYGLSDVGLRKICKRMKIPLPPQGYHLRSHKGKIRPLPPATKAEETYETQIARHESANDRESAGHLLPEIEIEKKPENKIVVAERLSSSPHRLVQITRDKIENCHADEFGRIVGDTGGGVAIRVFPDSVRRVLRIFDALLKTLESRGYELSVDKKMNLSAVKILDNYIAISCWGRTKRIPRPLTTEEQKKAKQNPQWEPYPKYEFLQTDELSIKLSGGFSCESTIADLPRRKLEDGLNEVIIRMVKLAQRVQIENEEHARRTRELEERRQRHQLLVQRHRDEQAKIDKLHKEASEWQKSQQLRAYIEAVRQAALKKDGKIDPDSELDEWINWAHQQADRLDPLVESPHSILDEKVPSFW